MLVILVLPRLHIIYFIIIFTVFLKMYLFIFLKRTTRIDNKYTYNTFIYNTTFDWISFDVWTCG